MILAAGFCDKTVSMRDIRPQTTRQTSAALYAPSFSQPVDFWVSQAAERRDPSSITNYLRALRAVPTWRTGSFFLFYILTFLSFFSCSNEKIIAFRDSRYIDRRPFIISFIQNADGRKRLFYLPQ